MCSICADHFLSKRSNQCTWNNSAQDVFRALFGRAHDHLCHEHSTFFPVSFLDCSQCAEMTLNGNVVGSSPNTAGAIRYGKTNIRYLDKARKRQCTSIQHRKRRYQNQEHQPHGTGCNMQSRYLTRICLFL